MDWAVVVAGAAGAEATELAAGDEARPAVNDVDVARTVEEAPVSDPCWWSYTLDASPSYTSYTVSC